MLNEKSAILLIAKFSLFIDNQGGTAKIIPFVLETERDF